MRWVVPLACLAASAPAPNEERGSLDPAALSKALRALDPRVLAGREDLPRMLERHARSGLREANRRETRLWREVKSREDWEKLREGRIEALRASLGAPPPPPRDGEARVTGTIEGEGFRIEKLVFESRPNIFVTANLYLPAAAPARPMAGIIICHSHHHPKEEGELQEMGVSWARSGCAVLVMDQLGHGERRQHPFGDPRSYPHPFRAGRQDYFFRYDLGMQLHLAGESLMG